MTASQMQVLEEVFLTKEEYLTPVQWAEANRVMTSEVSNFEGSFSYSRTPYAIEIVNLLQEGSPAQKVAVMKGAQIGFSTSVIENGIGWLMKYSPCNILLAAADDTLVREQFETKIDNMIDNSGLRELIGANAAKQTKRSGDKNDSKEFPGGRLFGRSLQTAGKWRQTSFKIMFIDDLDAVKSDDKREGAIINLIDQRAASYGDSAKTFYISTPTSKATSKIEPLYLKGDQRRYMVPCPCCGTFIPLEFQLEKDGEFYGIVWETDIKGNLIDRTVRYRCQSCGDTFKEDGNKSKMLTNGYWQPTAEPSEPGFYSYQISALYSPPGMNNWTYYVRQFISAVKFENPAEMKTFNNVVLGRTWEEKSQQPKATKISKNTRAYEIGLIPCELSRRDGNGEIVLVTCAADLNGLDTSNSKYDRDDARLDWEILAHSESGATYSIDQGSIGTFERRKSTEGRTQWTYKHNVHNSVWPEMEKIISRRYVTDDGRSFGVSMTGIDIGAYTALAWQFIDSMRAKGFNVVGIKGDTEVKKVSFTGEDQAYFAKSKKESNLFIVRTNLVKNNLSEYMALEWPRQHGQPPNFMNFPAPRGDKYTIQNFFKQFESEEKTVEVDANNQGLYYRWTKKTSTARNHFWDCRVYNLSLANIIMHLTAQEAKIKEPTWSLFCRLIKK
jgi:phage terminase large subunit GpA-like protein